MRNYNCYFCGFNLPDDDTKVHEVICECRCHLIGRGIE